MVFADGFMAYLLDQETRGGNNEQEKSSNMGCREVANAQQVGALGVPTYGF
jgi:hypothetical protein